MRIRGRSDRSALDWNGTGEVLLVQKPLQWSSFDVVKKIRSEFRVKKIGHTGTLDPRATGLLILCTGPMTKSVDQFSMMNKEYEGTLELGIRTASYDSETEVLERRDMSGVSIDHVLAAALQFTGKLLQAPPMYSAAKYGGKPLYRYARKGRSVERAEREIEVSEFRIVDFTSPFVSFRIVCSKGTYIRSLVNDLGTALGCGATLRSLCRTKIGPYRLEEALTIEEVIETISASETEKTEGHGYRASA